MNAQQWQYANEVRRSQGLPLIPWPGRNADWDEAVAADAAEPEPEIVPEHPAAVTEPPSVAAAGHHYVMVDGKAVEES